MPFFPGHKRFIRYTPQETATQMAFAEEMLVQGYALNAIQKELKAKLGITTSRATKIVERVHEKWKNDHEVNRKAWKYAQIARLTRNIRQASGLKNPDGTWKEKPNYSALARFENILADVQGTREPLQTTIDINVEMTETTATVVTMLDPAQMQDFLQAAKRRQALAEAHARAVGEVVETPLGLPLKAST